MRPPLPYFGNKTSKAEDIWKRFGDPAHYYEPFAGVLGVLLKRPEPIPRTRQEYVIDADCMITNFWRAAKLADRLEMARLADWPTNQLDLEARSDWLKEQRDRLRQGMKTDPNWYDLTCAAWYAWVQSVKISTNGYYIVRRRTAGVRRRTQDLTAYFMALRERLKDVTVDFGDWTLLADAAVMESKTSNVAILLDPPYSYATGRQKSLYIVDSPDVAKYVKRWAVAAARARPKLRIALCGFAGEHSMPDDWEEFKWSSKLGKGRERIWFSPSCL